MLGLVVALVYGAIVYFLGQPNTLAEIFLSATKLLFWWYIATSIIQGIIILLISLGLIGGGTALGVSEGGILGGILGFLGGGAISVLILVLFALSAGCSIGGAYLLHHSLTIASAGEPVWDIMKLIFGALLVFVGIILGKSSFLSIGRKN